MSLEEAYKILNVDAKISGEELQAVFATCACFVMSKVLIFHEQKFEHMFKANDRSAGGSFYLQSKIVRARERIEIEREQHPMPSTGPS
jgi:hypothetical protein